MQFSSPSPGAPARPLMPRCACGGIDVHAHMVPHAFPRWADGPEPAAWPAMAPRDACHRDVLVGGKFYRTVSDLCWDVEKRIADLDRMGIALQLLSPMPELFSYWMEAPAAAQLARFVNDEIAEMVSRGGGRFQGLAMLPLQDLDLALAELTRARAELGFAGVEIGSNVNGVPIGAPQFAPFFAACATLDAAVFVHAVRPAGMDRLVGPKNLEQVLAYPTDVGLAAASVICGNLPQRHPELRIAFSHGGGTLASLLPRLRQAVGVFPAVADCVAEDPLTQARRLYFDSLVFDSDSLRHLIQMFGADRLLIGTDRPFNFSDQSPLDRIAAACPDEAVVARLTHLNARAFLRLETP